MYKQSDDKDYLRAIFSIAATVIVVLAGLILLINTNSTGEIHYPERPEITMVTCKYDERADLNIVAEDAYRRGNTIRIKHPKDVFMIRDPLHRCTILQ